MTFLNSIVQLQESKSLTVAMGVWIMEDGVIEWNWNFTFHFSYILKNIDIPVIKLIRRKIRSLSIFCDVFVSPNCVFA